MRTISSIIALLLLAGLGFYFQDSFSRKTSLESPLGKTGVVFHDRLRATAGYHLVDNYLHFKNCSLVEKSELADFSFPGSFCTLLADGSYVSYISELTLWKADGSPAWKKSNHTHHDISVDEDTGTIFAIAGDFIINKTEKTLTRFDAIRGYALNGDEIFYWGMQKYKSQLEARLKILLPRHFNEPFFQYTHFNSVQEIPENATAAKIPAFRARNILVNDFKSRAIFIIDRQTQEIVWHHIPEKWLDAHSVRVNKEGQIVFLANSHAKKIGEPSYSAIDYFDPVTEEIVRSITVSPKEGFYTSYWGSLQHLPDHRFLVTNSKSGSAFEIDQEGRILWEWINPANTNTKTVPIYRVQVVPKARVKKMLSIWRPF